MKRPNVYQLSRKVGKCLLENGWTVAVAESCTGGGLAYAITSVAGSSQWFRRGVVTYTDRAKIELLGVKSETLAQFGEVSTQIANEMALGVIHRSRADFALSVTGIAGPTGGSEDKPVGTVCFGLAFCDGRVKTMRQQFSSGRKHVRDCSVGFALHWLLNEIKHHIETK